MELEYNIFSKRLLVEILNPKFCQKRTEKVCLIILPFRHPRPNEKYPGGTNIGILRQEDS